MRIKTKRDRRDRIKHRIRKRVQGSEERPRLTVFRSVAHMYVQVVDDMSGARSRRRRRSSRRSRGAGEGGAGGNVAGAKAIGKTIAERLLEKGVKRVVFDRNGFLYHGRVKAVADAAREAVWSSSRWRS
jgi:large subunit ribosomal protein L18